MYQGKPRPVPSKAALNALYQLAYISSGTAVGVAALCTEERRRRTQIVQKIADNAKRIRQSPRYYQNAAVAAQEPAEFGSGIEHFANSQSVSHGALNIRSLPSLDDGEVKGPELPSAVERGYERSRAAEENGRKVRRVRRPVRSEISNVAADAVSAMSGEAVHLKGTPGQMASASASEHPNLPSSPPRSETLPKPSHSELNKVPPKDWQNGPKSLSLSQENRAPPAGFTIRRVAAKPPVTSTIEHERFRTRAAWQELAAPHIDGVQAHFSSADVKYDRNLFFQYAKLMRMDGSLPAKGLEKLSQNLLRVSLAYGSLEDVRSLYNWRLLNDLLTSTDVNLIAGACRALSDRTDHGELFGFYSRICRDHKLQLDPAFRISVLVDVLDWDLDQPFHQRAFLVLGAATKPTGEALSPVLHATCQTLLASGQSQRAANALFAVKSYRSVITEFNELVCAVCTNAVATGELLVAANLLRLVDSDVCRGKLLKVCDEYLLACDRVGAHEMVLRVFSSGSSSLSSNHEGLSAQSQEIIAFACTQSKDIMDDRLVKRFNTAYRLVPESMRERIVESRTLLRLQHLWKSTHNLDLIQQEAHSMEAWLEEHDNGQQRHDLDMALLGIYISADRTDLALQMMSRMHKAQPMNSHLISLAALSFAKKGSWESLERLLAIAQDFKSFSVQQSQTGTRLNNAIHLYGCKHSAVDTWKFATRLVDILGFSPNHATTEIMLQHFVSKQTLELIPKWLRYVRILGQRIELDARIATKLLLRYYRDYRPSHVLMIWFCRNLQRMVPSLDTSAFFDLVKEAIGFDVRKASGNSAGLSRFHALTRLSFINNAHEGEMPSPGYKWNGQLFLKPPDAIPEATQSGANDSLPCQKSIPQADSHNSNESNLHEEDGNRGASLEKQLVGDVAVSRQYENDTRQRGPTYARTVLEEESYEALAAFNEGPITSTGQYDTVNDERALQTSTTAATEDDDLPSSIRFNDLRPQYHDFEPLPESFPVEYSETSDEITHVRVEDGRPRPERDMILALSLGRYAKVLDLYHHSLDAVGLPSSPLALEVAVEACLRLHCGSRSEAERIMAEARDAGMNITFAMGPLLLHQMRYLEPSEEREANNLRHTVIEYYRMNDENGWPVKHHVGVAAANNLITHRKAKDGLSVMDAIYRSKWVKRPMDIVPMTVFLKAYTELRSSPGIRWVIKTVLDQNLRIDQKFLRELRFTTRHFRGNKILTGTSSSHSMQGLVPHLVLSTQRCFERRMQQKIKAKILGKRLVLCLAKCLSEQEQPTIDVDSRGEYEAMIFGDRRSSRATTRRLRAKREVLRQLKLRPLGASRLNKERPLQPARNTRKWLQIYRAFLRRKLIMPDGKLAAFKYDVTGDSEGYTLTQKQGRQRHVDAGSNDDEPDLRQQEFSESSSTELQLRSDS